MLRRLRAFVVFALVVPLVLTGLAGTALADRQLMFFNHGYGVLDRETADAIEHSAYLREFASFQVRTTTGSGGQTWTGRYLYGRETYFEFFGVGDFPGTRLGSVGLAVSTEHAGDLPRARQRLADQGVKPLEFVQTRDFGDGVPVPWFDALYTTEELDSCFAWGMEYRAEYLADPRAKIGPPAYPGDVSRNRVLNEDYQKHLMRDVAALRVGLTERDLASTVPLLRAGGFAVVTLPGGVIATRGGSTIRLDTVPLAQVGLRQVDFTLNRPLGTRHEQRIGRSTLVVGPGSHAVWTFDPRG